MTWMFGVVAVWWAVAIWYLLRLKKGCTHGDLGDTLSTESTDPKE